MGPVRFAEWLLSCLSPQSLDLSSNPTSDRSLACGFGFLSLHLIAWVFPALVFLAHLKLSIPARFHIHFVKRQLLRLKVNKIDIINAHLLLKTSRVYCLKRRYQTGSSQSQHSHKRDLHMSVPASLLYVFIYSFFLQKK